MTAVGTTDTESRRYRAMIIEKITQSHNQAIVEMIRSIIALYPPPHSHIMELYACMVYDMLETTLESAGIKFPMISASAVEIINQQFSSFSSTNAIPSSDIQTIMFEIATLNPELFSSVKLLHVDPNSAYDPRLYKHSYTTLCLIPGIVLYQYVVERLSEQIAVEVPAPFTY